MKSPEIGYSTVLFIRSDAHGKQLLLQKKDRGYKNFPDHWTLFGGNIKNAETAIDCLLREVKQELGLTCSPESFKLFKEIEVKRLDEKVPLRLYLANFDYSINELSLGEGCGFAFWYLDEISNLKLIPHEKALFYEVRKSLEI